MDVGRTNRTTADATVTVSASSGDLLGAGVAAADVDGDGVDDLIAGASGVRSTGAVFVFLGPVSGAVDASAADVRLLGDGDNTGEHVVVLGDTDGDGLGDVGVCSTASTWLSVLRDPARGLGQLADAPLIVRLDLGPGCAALAGADVDGDGLEELIVGTGTDPAALVFAAAGTGTLGQSDALAEVTTSGAGDAGGSVARLADRDGDGSDEVLVGGKDVGVGGEALIVPGASLIP